MVESAKLKNLKRFQFSIYFQYERPSKTQTSALLGVQKNFGGKRAAGSVYEVGVTTRNCIDQPVCSLEKYCRVLAGILS